MAPPTPIDDSAPHGQSFLCNTSNTKGNREMSHGSYTLNASATRSAKSCPTTTDFTAFGLRNIACDNSKQIFTPPPYVADKAINSAPEQTTCRTRPAGGSAQLLL